MERPYVTVFSTMSVDGRIASSTGYSVLSCRYDKARLYLLRGMVDAVMVGANTLLVDNSTLRKRLRPVRQRYLRVVIDGRLRLHPGLRIFTEPGPQVVVFTASSSQERIEALRRRGVDVLRVPGSGGRVDLAKALQVLAENYGVRRLLVEGGGVLNYSLAEARLIDEVRVTIAAKIFAAGRSFFDDPGGRGFPRGEEAVRLRLACTEPCPCLNCVHIVYEAENPQGTPLDTGPERCLSPLAKRAVEENWQPTR